VKALKDETNFALSETYDFAWWKSRNVLFVDNDHAVGRLFECTE
jgi:hypothetical protein